MSPSIQWSDEMGQASPDIYFEPVYRAAIAQLFQKLTMDEVIMVVQGNQIRFAHSDSYEEYSSWVEKTFFFFIPGSNVMAERVGRGNSRPVMEHAMRAYVMGWGPFMFYRIGMQIAERLEREEGN